MKKGIDRADKCRHKGHMNTVALRAAQAALEAEVKATATALKAVPGHGSGAMGLTPDDVRARSDWQAAKRASETAFNALRNFNGKYAKILRKKA